MSVFVNKVLLEHSHAHSFTYDHGCFGASLVARLVKNLPAMWETWFLSLGWEDPLEEGMASVFLPGESPWTEEPGGLQSMGSQKVGQD